MIDSKELANALTLSNALPAFFLLGLLSLCLAMGEAHEHLLFEGEARKLSFMAWFGMLLIWMFLVRARF